MKWGLKWGSKWGVLDARPLRSSSRKKSIKVSKDLIRRFIFTAQIQGVKQSSLDFEIGIIGQILIVIQQSLRVIGDIEKRLKEVWNCNGIKSFLLRENQGVAGCKSFILKDLFDIKGIKKYRIENNWVVKAIKRYSLCKFLKGYGNRLFLNQEYIKKVDGIREFGVKKELRGIGTRKYSLCKHNKVKGQRSFKAINLALLKNMVEDENI